MRYSLSSRFRGALLGAALGEILGTQFQLKLQAHPAHYHHLWSNLQQWGFSEISPASQIAGWGKVVVSLAQGLIQGGGGEATWVDEVADCLEHNFSKASNSALFPQKGDRTAPSSQTLQTTGSGLALAALPIALFFHADLDQLEQELELATQLCPNHPNQMAGLQAMGYAISLALREQLHPTTLIHELVDELSPNQQAGAFIRQLQDIQSLLEQNVPLEAIATQIRRGSPLLKPEDTVNSTLPLAIALYCFLCTPDDFRLSLLRAAQIRHGLPLACALVGALSGAYNGIGGIPINWRMALNPGSCTRSPLHHLWGLTTATELENMANQLLAAWSGVYDLNQLSKFPGTTLAVAAPRVIRPR